MIRTFSTLGIFLFAFLPLAAQSGRIVLPHFAADKTKFETQIMVENRTQTNKPFAIRSVDSNGNFVALTNLELNPGERRYLEMPQIGGTEASHAMIDGGQGILAGVVYIPVQNQENRIFIEAIDNFSKRWRVYPNNWKDTFDGLVIVNPACFETSVEISLFGADGALVDQLTRARGLASGAKWVLDPADHFEYQPGAYFEINSTLAVAVMSLKGTLQLDRDDSFLVGNLAMAEDGNEQLRLELEANRDKWTRSGFGGSYSMQMRRICFCVPDYLNPVNIDVSNFEFASVTDAGSGEPVELGRVTGYHTVSSLFDFIERALDLQAANVYVTYDETYGYPTMVSVDWDVCLADEETGYAITELEPLDPN